MIYSFGPFELDLARFELRQDGQQCALEPQVFALLAYLVEHRERLVAKSELFEKLWEGRIVSDSALASRIKSARQALGDDGRAQRFIKTIHGRGFRFVADVHTESDRPLPDVTVSGAAHDAEPAGDNPQTSRPSIAVLAFETIGDAGEYGTIAAGLPHELIAEMARLRWLFVVSRSSSFRLQGNDRDPREVGRLLGVRYCLTGTMEIVGERLRITVELADTRDGAVLWGEAYAGAVHDVHAMRDEIRRSILASLEIQIPLHEAAHARLIVSQDLDAWSAYHLGLQYIYRFNQKDNTRAAELFQRAADKEPGFARAHAGLSFVHFQTAFMHQAQDSAREVALARNFAQRAIDLDPLDPFVNFTMGRSYWLEGDLDSALGWLDRSTSLCPNFAQGLYARAWTETMAGTPKHAPEHLELAMRLSPLDPLYYAMLSARGLTLLAEGKHSEAAKWLERGARAPGAHVLIAMIAAGIQQLAGNESLAHSWADDVRLRRPELTREQFFRAFPMRSPKMRNDMSNALQAVGF